MAKIFLRSGSLDALLALGENGQPLWLSALQLRETLRLRKQSQIADCLAIPQPNDAGDRLDWYSPVSGKVTSWAAASNSARAAALTRLRACQQAMNQLSEQARESEKPSQRLFGTLLSKALQFPDEFHVYLVDGNPVITFWGFVSLEKRAHKDALDCLQLADDDTPQLGLSRLAVPAATAAAASAAAPAASAAAVVPQSPAPAASPVQEPVIIPAIPPLQIVDEPPTLATAEPQPAPVLPAPPAAKGLRGGWLRYGWALPVAAMLVAAGVQWLPQLSSSQAQAPQPPVTALTPPAAATAAPQPGTTPLAPPAIAADTAGSPPQQTVAANTPPAATHATAQNSTAAAPAQTVAGTAAPAAATPATQAGAASATSALPLAPASHTETAPAAVAVAEPQPAVELPPAEKDDLVLPADAVKLGSAKFLNGNWRVIVQQATPLTGRPPQVKYQLRNGKGTARITQGDGVTCRADVDAAVMPSGNLVIKSRTTARCTDGTRYRMPELLCRQGATGAAQCNGSYNDRNNTVLPMTMKRETR